MRCCPITLSNEKKTVSSPWLRAGLCFPGPRKPLPPCSFGEAAPKPTGTCSPTAGSVRQRLPWPVNLKGRPGGQRTRQAVPCRVATQGWQGRRGIELTLLGPCQGTPFRVCVLGRLTKRVQARLPWPKIRKMERPPQDAGRPGKGGAEGLGGSMNTRKTCWLGKKSFMTLVIDRELSPHLPLKGRGQGPHPERARSAFHTAPLAIRHACRSPVPAPPPSVFYPLPSRERAGGEARRLREGKALQALAGPRRQGANPAPIFRSGLVPCPLFIVLCQGNLFPVLHRMLTQTALLCCPCCLKGNGGKKS